VRFFVLLSIVFFAATTTASPAQRVLTFEDLRRIVTVSQPRISPNGTQIVYVRSTVDWKADRNRSELVLVNVDGTGARTLTHGRIGVTNPQWSPDGTRLAFLASPEAGKPAQLYVMPMNGGDALQITTNKTGVQNYAWRPDGAALAYVSDDDPANQKALDKHLDAVVITDNDYLTTEAPQPAHLWLVDATGGSANRLTSGNWSIVKGGAPVWAPDGSKIYYQRQPDPVFAHMVSQTTYAYDVASKTSADLGFGMDSDPRVGGSDSGSLNGVSGGPLIAITKPRHGTLYLQNDVSIRSLSDGHEVFSSSVDIDRNVHSYFWLGPDLIVSAANGVRSVAFRVGTLNMSNGTSGGPVRPGWAAALGAIFAPQFDSRVDFSGDATATTNRAIAFVGLTRDRPGEIYYLAPNSTVPRQITNENAWMSDYAIARSEEFTWRLDNGMAADGVLTYPVHYVAGRKYPLVLDIHGGPISTSTWDMAGLEGLSLVQILAAHDYFVLRPNYRGSDNMGDAFLQAIVGDMASGPGRDTLAAVAALRATGMIDESRIGVSGWSGGGLQTS